MNFEYSFFLFLFNNSELFLGANEPANLPALQVRTVQIPYPFYLQALGFHRIVNYFDAVSVHETYRSASVQNIQSEDRRTKKRNSRAGLEYLLVGRCWSGSNRC